MASNFTEHFQLNQWEPGDQVKREDFNADNAKIDAALGALAAGKGNCEIVTGSYVGTGEFGPDHPCVLTFSHRPIMVILCYIGSRNGVPVIPIMVPESTELKIGGECAGNRVTMTERSVSWYTYDGTMSAVRQANAAGATYYYIAFLEV